jgi:hypothetical protein
LGLQLGVHDLRRQVLELLVASDLGWGQGQVVFALAGGFDQTLGYSPRLGDTTLSTGTGRLAPTQGDLA